nr:MAG TPA: hypothetical protein [Caudoviricetes sp.]
MAKGGQVLLRVCKTPTDPFSKRRKSPSAPPARQPFQPCG